VLPVTVVIGDNLVTLVSTLGSAVCRQQGERNIYAWWR
jgi:hypothetical protein